MAEKSSEYQKKYRRQYKAQNKRISITVSNAEYGALSQMALRENKKVTTLAKEYTFSSLTDSLVMPQQIQNELNELSLLIRNIANNVNQIARHSNRIHRLVADDEHSLLQYLQSLEEKISDYTEGRLQQDSS